jgi:hypothetical protein
VKAFAQLFTNEKLGVDQINNQHGIGQELRKTRQIVARSRLLATPPTLAEIDPHNGCQFTDGNRRQLGQESLDSRLLSRLPLPLKFN